MPFPLDTSFVDRAAEKLGIRPPISYIVKMQRSNGGNIEVSNWWARCTLGSFACQL